MRAIWSVRPKCSHRCVSLKETSLKPVPSSTQPKTQPSKPLWERNGLNISRFKLFRRISYKKVFVYVDQSLLHWCKRGLHLHWCKRLLGDHFSSWPKHLLHPLLTTLGKSEVSGLCSRHLGSQSTDQDHFQKKWLQSVLSGPKVQKSTEHPNREIYPRTLSRQCSRKCPRECTRRCPRKCPRRLRLFLCKTHQRIPTKTPTRVLTGKSPVLTQNLPVLTKMYTKVSSVNFHMSYFHMFCFLANLSVADPEKHVSRNSFLKNYWFYSRTGPVWNELSLPVISRLWFSCGTNYWNQSERYEFQ